MINRAMLFWGNRTMLPVRRASMSTNLSNKIIRVFSITVLGALFLASCSMTDNPIIPNNIQPHTVNDLSTVTCVFHSQAMGQPIDDTIRHTRDSSLSIGRAQRDCYKKAFRNNGD